MITDDYDQRLSIFIMKSIKMLYSLGISQYIHYMADKSGPEMK